MIAENCEYDGFGHVHFQARLQRNDCTVGAVKIVKAFVDCGVENRRLASEKSTASFNFLFLGAKNIGGKAPKEAFAWDVSRARLLKNAPT